MLVGIQLPYILLIQNTTPTILKGFPLTIHDSHTIHTSHPTPPPAPAGESWKTEPRRTKEEKTRPNSFGGQGDPERTGKGKDGEGVTNMAKLVESLMAMLLECEAGTRNQDEEGTLTWVSATKSPITNMLERTKALIGGVATTPTEQPKIAIPAAIEQWAAAMINSSTIPWNEAKIKEYQALDTGAPKESPRKAIMKILKDKGICTCSDADIAKSLHFHEHYTSWCNWTGCEHNERIVASGDAWQTLACTPVHCEDGTRAGLMDNTQRTAKHNLDNPKPTMATPASAVAIPNDGLPF